MIVPAVLSGIYWLLNEYWETESNADLWTCAILSFLIVYIFSAIMYKRVRDTSLPYLAFIAFLPMLIDIWYDCIVIPCFDMKPFPALAYMLKHVDTLNALNITHNIIFALLFILCCLPSKKQMPPVPTTGN